MVKVLLIDDEQIIRDRMKKIIDKEGFETLLASNGEEGVEIFHKDRPEIVITDLKLPGIDGMEVMHAVKNASSEVEVILITGHGEYDIAIQALRNGAIDYLKKPIDVNQLLVALGRCREKIRSRAETKSQPSILVLDDKEVTRTKLARILSKEGYQIYTGCDGQEGIELFKKTKIDIILADLKMPKMNGLEVLREAKKLTDDVEVILVTGYGDEDTAIQSMRQGAMNYLKKPIDIDQMVAAIEQALEKLKIKRNLLYKTRDLELAQEVLARVTKNKEITIDISDSLQNPARVFAREFIDTIPAPLFVVDKDCNVVFSNKFFSNAFNESPGKIDDDWP